MYFYIHRFKSVSNGFHCASSYHLLYWELDALNFKVDIILGKVGVIRIRRQQTFVTKFIKYCNYYC